MNEDTISHLASATFLWIFDTNNLRWKTEKIKKSTKPIMTTHMKAIYMFPCRDISMNAPIQPLLFLFRTLERTIKLNCLTLYIVFAFIMRTVLIIVSPLSWSQSLWMRSIQLIQYSFSLRMTNTTKWIRKQNSQLWNYVFQIN